MSTWREPQHWAGMALQAAAALPAREPWTTRVVAVLAEPGAGPGAAAVAAGLRAQLGAMWAVRADPLPRWDDELSLLRPDLVAAAGPDAPQTMPLLAAGSAQAADPVSLLLGFTPADPVAALVVVQRGYLTAVHARAGGVGAGEEFTARTYLPAGERFPGEMAGAQPVLAAFAVDVRTGEGATMARRVAGPGQQLSAAQAEAVTDLEPEGEHLGVPALSMHPGLVVQALLGRGLAVPELDQLVLPQPGWLVGRYWLNLLLEAVWSGTHSDGERTTLDAEAITAAVTAVSDPPRDLAASWAAVRADQRGPRALGALLSDTEAALLPGALLPEACLARSPSQGWMWKQLRVLGSWPAGKELLQQLRERFRGWPELVEPEQFLGAALSRRD